MVVIDRIGAIGASHMAVEKCHFSSLYINMDFFGELNEHTTNDNYGYYQLML